MAGTHKRGGLNPCPSVATRFDMDKIRHSLISQHHFETERKNFVTMSFPSPSGNHNSSQVQKVHVWLPIGEVLLPAWAPQPVRMGGGAACITCGLSYVVPCLYLLLCRRCVSTSFLLNFLAFLSTARSPTPSPMRGCCSCLFLSPTPRSGACCTRLTLCG
jgi:hypothetical protein